MIFKNNYLIKTVFNKHNYTNVQWATPGFIKVFSLDHNIYLNLFSDSKCVDIHHGCLFLDLQKSWF